MRPTNLSTLHCVIIKGISDVPELQAPIFLLVLLIYLITLCGNMTIVILVWKDDHLHTPMYFFLTNLSILDMTSSTTTLHRILINFISGDKTISVTSCFMQMYFFSSLTCDELVILTTMSYDRYMAICNPLRYHAVMNYRVCIALATACWTVGFLQVTPVVISISRYKCFRSNEINHFFCDIMPLLKLPCGDISLLELYIFLTGVLLAIFPFLLTFVPYLFIITSILKIRSSTGRRKAFYTCSSHLMVIVLLYGTLVCQYLRPKSEDNLALNKLFSLFNTTAVPMLNPLIYSLKNRDVMLALKRRFTRV